MKRWIKKIIVRIREGYLKEIYKETVWMYQYVKRYWFSICFYILAGVFGTVMGLGSSVVSKYLIDAVTGVRKDKILLFAVLIRHDSSWNYLECSHQQNISKDQRCDTE